MNLNLINERYTDSRYHSYYVLQEQWSSYTDNQKRFIKECEDITNSIFPELLEEGPLDKARSRAAGAWTGAKNLGKSLTGRGAEAEDVGQRTLNKRVKLFQRSVGKVLGELQRDLGKMGIQGEDHPTILAINYINGSAGQIGTEQYPIKVKAGALGRVGDDLRDDLGELGTEVLEWTNKRVQKLLTDIKAAADPVEVVPGMEFPGTDTYNFSDRVKKHSGQALQNIEALVKKHPKMTNFAIGALVAASRLSGIPGSGIVAGLLLRSAVGVIKGEDIQQAVSSAAKVAVVGTVAGAAIGELGDALSDNPDQIEGALDQAEDAGEDAAGEGGSTRFGVGDTEVDNPDELSPGEQGSAEMQQQQIDSHKETIMQGRELGIPDDYKLSFNNGKLSVNSQELMDLINGPNGDEVLGALRANELSRVQVDDWLPSAQRLSDRGLNVKVHAIDLLDKIRQARRG